MTPNTDTHTVTTDSSPVYTHTMTPNTDTHTITTDSSPVYTHTQ